MMIHGVQPECDLLQVGLRAPSERHDWSRDDTSSLSPLLLWIPGAGEAGLRRAVCAKIPFAMITIDSPLERVNYPDRITGGSRGPRPREVRSEGAA